MVKEKTALELIEDKEAMIKEYDLLIHNASLKSMKKNIAERDQRRKEKQEIEDKGWATTSVYHSDFVDTIGTDTYVNPDLDERPEPEPEPKEHILLEEELAEIEKAELIEKKKAELKAQLAELEGE